MGDSLSLTRNNEARPSAPDFEQLRREFPGTEKWIYMDVAGRCLIPRQTRAALDRHNDERMYDGGDKAAMFEAAEGARSLFARLIGADAEEVALTKNISEGLNIIASAIPWQAGDNVVVCPELEHPNNIYLWLHLQRQRGIEVRTVAPQDGHVPVDRMLAAADGRTRLITVSAVTFRPGFRTNVAALGEGCRSRGILLLVDGAQSVGILDTNVRELKIDALAVSTQKGLLGLYGMGFLYCGREWAERMTPTYLARFGVDLGDAHESDAGDPNFRLMPGARRFDLGNHNFPAAVAAKASLELLLGAGMAAVERHVTGLAARLADGLLDLGLPVQGGRAGPHLANIVTLGTRGGAGSDSISGLYEFLGANGVKLSVRQGLLRFSLHLYNNASDVDRALKACARWQAGSAASAAAE